MDPRFLKYYNQELQFMREMGGEFAQEFPKIAGRLGLDSFECADPYVERLLEGFAFLAARVQLKIDSEFPRFTQHLLSMVYPDYLAPIPSMAVVQFTPDLMEGSLVDGFVVPRQSSLRSLLGKDDQTACEYRTAHDVTLWPLELHEANYISGSGAVASLGLPDTGKVKAAIRLCLRCTAGLNFNQLSLSSLSLFMRGSGELPTRIYEQFIANGLGVVVRPKGELSAHSSASKRLSKSNIQAGGFDDLDAILPYTKRSFEGYRLLQEYFAFHERFLFLNLNGLDKAVKQCAGNELEIIVLLDRSEPQLENILNKDNFSLFCTPAVNLFPKRADRIHLTNNKTEYHLVPDRTRPMDFETHSIKGLTGYGTSTESEQAFRPFYSLDNSGGSREKMAYFTQYREPRMFSGRQRVHGPRSSYVGSEVFVSLVDANEAPYSSKLRQLGIELLCTNRDLPLHMPVGKGKTDFTMESSAPVLSVRCVAGPTKPRPAHSPSRVSWDLISHLSLNYLSLVDNNDGKGAEALRELLRLYSDENDVSLNKQIDGLLSVTSQAVIRRVPISGPMAMARGVEITLEFEETAFEGVGIFLLGAVLEQFLARYVGINSFTQTVVRSSSRGEIMRWPVRIGRCPTI